MRPLFSFTISTFFVAIPLAWYGFGYWSLVAMQAVDMVVSALALGLAARKLLVWPRFSRHAFADLWRLSLGFEDQSTLSLSHSDLRQVHHRPRARHGDTRNLHAGLVLLERRHRHSSEISPASSLFPAMAKVPGRRGEASERALEIFLRTRAADATCQRILRHLRTGARRSSARGQMAHGRRAIRDPVRDVVFLPRLAQLRHALSRHSDILSWITAVLICRAAALIAGIWWVAPHGLTAICAVIGVVMALMLAIMLIIVKTRDRPPAPTRRSGARPTPRGHGSSERSLSRGQGALARVAGPGPGNSDASLAPIFIFLSSSFSTRSASSAQAVFLRSTDPITEEDETHSPHRHA